MLNDCAVGPAVRHLRYPEPEAKPSGGVAPTRLAASMTVVDPIPVTAPSASATEPPGTVNQDRLGAGDVAPAAVR